MTEKPPRRVQAPKVRQHERRPAAADDDRRRRLLLYVLAASGLAALAVVAVVLSRGGDAGDTGAVAAAMKTAGCTYETVPAQEAKHVDLGAKPKWNTDPPSSGSHYGQYAPWGTYEEPVDQLRLIHNLEHGGVVLQYGDDAPEGTQDELTRFWREDPNGMLVAPRPQLGDEIALTAWTIDETRAREEGYHGEGHLARCPRFDEDAFATFRDELRFKGPERFPADALEPGE